MAQVLPFNGFNIGDSEKNSARLCINYMPIRHDSGALSEYSLDTTTGISGPKQRTFSSNPGNILSDVITWGNSIVGSIGSTVISATSNRQLIFSSGDVIAQKQIPGGVVLQDVRFAPSAENLLINTRSDASQQSVYIFDGTNNPIAEVDISAAIGLGGNENIADTVYYGNRFLLMSEDDIGAHQGRVYYSGINDPASYGGLDFFRTLDQTSKNTGVHIINDRLYLFSDNGYTVWTVSPSVNLPYSQQKGSAGSIGLLDPMGKCELGGVLYFIGRSGGKSGLYAMGGGAPQKISSVAVDLLLNDNNTKGFIRCFSFYEKGHSIIAFTFGDNTVCYNTNDGDFHTRSTNGIRWEVIGAGYSEGNNDQQVMIGQTMSLISGTTYNVNTGIQNDSLGTEFGVQMPREMVTSPFNSDGVTNNVREIAFQTDIDYTQLAPVTLPDLSLSVSENFGKTFEAERLEAFDADGENTKILRYMNIGFFRQAFVFKLKTDTIYPHKILKMMVRLEKGFRQI